MCQSKFNLPAGGGMAFGIDWIHIKIIIRYGDLGIRVVDRVFKSPWWRIRFWWWSGFLIPKLQASEDLLYYKLFRYKRYSLHLS